MARLARPARPVEEAGEWVLDLSRLTTLTRPVSAAQLCFFQTGLGALGRLRTLPHTGVLAGARH